MSKKNKPAPAFAKLEALKAEMQVEADAKKAAAQAAAERAKERGDLMSRSEQRRAAAAAAPPVVAAPKRSSVEVWRPENFDQHLFDVAMAGVRPLDDAPKRVTNHNVAPSAGRKRVAVETKMKQALAAGGPELDVRWNPDGTVTGTRRGHEFAAEALGRFSTAQDTLDLHGLDAATASLRVAEFVRSRRARGMRCVEVIHGRGARSPDGGVLLDAVVSALKGPPASNEVDGFCTTPDTQCGAMLIALRV